MKILSSALVAAGLVALAACGGGEDEAANNVGAETLNVAPDDLGNDLIIDDLGNDLGDNTTLNATEDAVETNTAGNTL